MNMEIDPLVEELAANLTGSGLKLATAESCTGGLVGAMCTALPGSSDWFYGGVIAYDNSLKMNLLQVRPEILAEFGAVSPQTAAAMAAGAIKACGSDCALALTGVAGPDGGSPEKPVGLVVIGLAWPGQTGGLEITTHSQVYPGPRAAVRLGAARQALSLLNRQLANLNKIQCNAEK